MKELMAITKSKKSGGTGVYQVAINTLHKHLPPAAVAECIANTTLIEAIESSQTIKHPVIQSTLTAETKAIIATLEKYEINAGRMTIDEAHIVHDYVTGTTQDVICDKVGRIRDALTLILHGKKARRDYSHSTKRGEELMRLIDKADEWESGKYDMSRGFDLSMYPMATDEENGEFPHSYFSGHTMDRREFESIMNEFTDEELLAGEYVSPDDLFVYGPYTRGDLRVIAKFSKETWSKVTDHRLNSRLEDLLEDIMDVNDHRLDSDIHRNFITRTIIPTRRPSARNIIRLLASFGQECNVLLDEEHPKKFDEMLESLQSSLSWCSYYAIYICQLQVADIKKQHKAARPTNNTFYQDILEIVEKWDDVKADRIDADQGPYLVKLDDHFMVAQKLYIRIRSSAARSTAAKKQAVRKQQALLATQT